MKLFINENSCDEKVFTAKNLKGIIAVIEETALPESHVITTIKLNGVILSLEDEKNIAEKYPFERIESLEIISADPSQLILDAFQVAPEVLQSLLEMMNVVIENFRQGETNQGITLFQRYLEWLQWFNDILSHTEKITRIDYGQVVVNNCSLAELNQKLLRVYEDIAEAQMNNDWINLSDILEYEFAPVLQDWIEVLPEFFEYLKNHLGQPN